MYILSKMIVKLTIFLSYIWPQQTDINFPKYSLKLIASSLSFSQGVPTIYWFVVIHFWARFTIYSSYPIAFQPNNSGKIVGTHKKILEVFKHFRVITKKLWKPCISSLFCFCFSFIFLLLLCVSVCVCASLDWIR